MARYEVYLTQYFYFLSLSNIVRQYTYMLSYKYHMWTVNIRYAIFLLASMMELWHISDYN